MVQKIEGTLLLEGLVEGPLPPFPDALERLEKWTGAHRTLRMTVQGDAGRFSILPGGEAITVAGEDASNMIADALQELLGLFPPVERGQVFSTLRSTEWRHKQEIRTIYTVGPNGRAATHQESAAAQTLPPVQTLDTRQMIKRGAIGLLIAAALIGVSALFIDYPKALRQLTATTEKIKVTVNEGDFSPYLHMDVNAIDHKDGMLEVHLARTDLYPLTDAAVDALYAHPALPTAASATAPATAASTGPATRSVGGDAGIAPGQVRRRMAVEALARGTVHLEFYDAKGHFIGETAMRTVGLQDANALQGEVAAPVIDGALAVPASVTLRP